MPLPYREFLALTQTPKRAIVLLVASGIVAGAVNAALVAIVGETLRGEAHGPRYLSASLFVLLAVASVVLQRFGQSRIARLSEEANARLRIQVLDRLFHARLCDSERIDAHAARMVLSRDTVQVAGTLPSLIGLLGSLSTVVCALLYICWLSPVAGAVVLGVIVLSVGTYQRLTGRTRTLLREAYTANDRAFGFIDDLLQGHKDLKLDARWSREFVGDDLVPAVRRASDLLGAVRIRQQDLSLIGVIAFFALLGALSFAAPAFGLATGTLVNVLLILLFTQAHILGIVQRLPGLQEMAHSARRIRQLLEQLANPEERSSGAIADGMPDWASLRLNGVSYSYAPDAAPPRFQLSDVNLEVPRGSTVFIVGGNGSGKTTLAKVLTGLYAPSRGQLSIDSTPIDASNRSAFRGLFNAVFSDVHLFRRRFTGPIADRDNPVHQTLADMAVELHFLEDQRLDTRPYSQGQRKRVASALALLSDCPICLFDEWTADQDPEFRAYFYLEYLPRLKAAGKTVFVITHDDRYFHHADFLVKMEGGTVLAFGRPQDIGIVESLKSLANDPPGSSTTDSGQSAGGFARSTG